MYSFGTIVLVPFPFTDLTSSKLRPALIISKKTREDVLVCFITSQQKNSSSTAPLGKSEQTGLKVDSTVHFDKIATLNKKIILGELGRVNKTWITQYKRKFYNVFGF